MVGADLKSLVSPHHKSRLAILLVLEKSNISSSTLLPLVGLTNKLEQLGAHLEGLLLNLLTGLNLNLLSKTDNRLEVDILGLRSFVLKEELISISQTQPAAGRSEHTSSSFWALADPDLSFSSSSSSFFSFLAPPPNIEKTLLEATVAAEVTVAAAVVAAAVACSVTVCPKHQC